MLLVLKQVNRGHLITELHHNYNQLISTHVIQAAHPHTIYALAYTERGQIPNITQISERIYLVAIRVKSRETQQSRE